VSSRRKRSKRLRAATQAQTPSGGRAPRPPAVPAKRPRGPQAPKTAKPAPLLARAGARWKRPQNARPEPARVPAPPTADAPLDRAAFASAGLVAVVALVFYLLTVDPTLPTGDSGDLITSAYVLGVPHPPGYPLYMLLGRLATLVPAGSPALRVNLLSCLFDAVAVGVVFLAAYRLIGSVRHVGRGLRDRVPAFAAAAAGAWLLAFSTLFWGYSEVAEVFALNNLFAALLLFLGLEWCRRPERVRLLWAFAFVLGLALTNQQTIVLLVPAFLVLAWAGAAALRRHGQLRVLAPRSLAVAVGLFVAGLLPYLYLPLAASASPPMNWGDPTTFGRFVDVVTRKDYGTLSLTGGESGSIGKQLAVMAASLVHSFVGVGLVLAALGLLWAWRTRRAEGIALAVAFLAAGPGFVAYANPAYPDELTKGIVARFYILPSIPIGILAGLGAWWVLERAAAARVAPRRPGITVAVAGAALLAAPVAAAAVHYRTADQSGNRVAFHYGEDVLSSLRPNALLIMSGDENATSISYLQHVEHERPDVVALDSELLKLPTYVAQARREHPGVVIPFAAYDGGVTTSLNDLIRANLAKRPVYYVGVQDEKGFAKPFDQLREGLVRRLLPKGAAPNQYALLLREPNRLERLHWPLGSYPAKSWEAAIAGNYGYAAFDVGFALQRSGDKAAVKRIEEMYRLAIRLNPTLPPAYKDLGLVLRENGGDPQEVAALWRRYLELNPKDPQAPAIESVVSTLTSTTS
jgi:hypothetical protein